MKTKKLLVYLLLAFTFIACKKDNPVPVPKPVPEPKPTVPDTVFKVTSAEFDGKLLFVTKNNYQISVSRGAVFSSRDAKIKISSSGLVERITSGEVVQILIKSKLDTTKKWKIYALGATDNQHDEPYSKYHDYGNSSTNPYSDYKKGWETLQKMPIANETYALVLRHADASVGSDKTDSTEPEWWKSGDATLVRQLNQDGIDKSIELGKIFKDLQFPITRIVSSEFRRATQTADLLSTGLEIKTDGRLNHPSYNKSRLGLFTGMVQVVQEQPVDNNLTLITAHHPMNELKTVDNLNFPKVMAFTWTGGYFVKVAPDEDKTLSYQGSVSYGMMKHWRDLKLGKL